MHTLMNMDTRNQLVQSKAQKSRIHNISRLTAQVLEGKCSLQCYKKNEKDDEKWWLHDEKLAFWWWRNNLNNLEAKI